MRDSHCGAGIRLAHGVGGGGTVPAFYHCPQNLALFGSVWLCHRGILALLFQGFAAGDVYKRQALAYMQGIEADCRQKVTGIVNNTPLCGETTAAEILKGADLAGQLSRQTGLPVVCHAVERRLVPQVENTLIEPILPMDLYMKKPWEITTCEEEHLLWPEP